MSRRKIEYGRRDKVTRKQRNREKRERNRLRNSDNHTDHIDDNPPLVHSIPKSWLKKEKER